MAQPDLRLMSVQDVTAVAAIEAAVQPHGWSPAQFESSLAAGHQGVVLVEGDVCIGFAVWLDNSEEVELLNIAVQADHQGHGWGRVLLEAVKARARAGGVRRVLLEVRASNGPARTLYETSGFAVYHIRKGYYRSSGGPEDALLMECRLCAE